MSGARRVPDRMGGFAKGLAVIEVFDAAHPRLAIAEAARLAGLDRATARRCLLTLAEAGYATYDGKFFELTPRVLRLGHAYLEAAPLPALVQPILEQLSQATGESSSASVLDGAEITYIARASRRRVMSITLTPGSRLPAYCASMGRVLLASLPEARALALLEAGERPALTPLTKITIEALRTELELVRTQGYAVIDQELEMGLRSIAVPIADRAGRTLAAINIGAQASRVTVGEMIERYLPALRAARRRFAEMLP
jgi:IclR family transcriptional regulator, pca regulon regulatory protein